MAHPRPIDARPGWFRTLAVPIGAFSRQAMFAYGTIVLLQLKVIWGSWRLRDLTTGDTAYYFIDAYEFYRNWGNSIAWSPLYTSFYGALLYLDPDPYFVTILHRVLIVLTLAMLVLAVMRRLLPHPAAWLVAAWWTLLPINFDALYEVHLFGVIPVLLAWMAILRPGRGGRAWAVAILLAAPMLIRNELLVAAGLVAAADVAHAWRVGRGAAGALARVCRDTLRSYGAPLAAAAVLVCVFYSQSRVRWPALGAALGAKHTLNVCQVYAFGHQQRHPEWRGSPWTECADIMQRDFRASDLTMAEAFRRNPRAMMDHFVWNLTLLPSGLQVLLFNEMSGQVNPDFAPVTGGSSRALAASILLLAILLSGSLLFAGDLRGVWNDGLKDRIWSWTAMGAVAIGVVLVSIMQRPRPSYMFALGLAAMASAGMSMHLVARRWSALHRWPPLFPVLVVMIIALAPRYYAQPHRFVGRPLLDAYRRLSPFADLMKRRDTVIVTPGYGGELCSYLAVDDGRTCQGAWFYALRDAIRPGQEWADVLREQKATLFYADHQVLGEPVVQPFTSDPVRHGWAMIAFQRVRGQEWKLFQRIAP